MTKREQILELRSQGLSYTKIKTMLNCSKQLIVYYCNNPEKQKEKRRLCYQRRKIKQHPFKTKLNQFVNTKRKNKINRIQRVQDKTVLYTKIASFNTKGNKMGMITLEEVQNKFGDNTVCYLTGEPIDVTKPRTYQFDHKVPASRNGDNSIDNLGICTKQANQAKSDLTEDEFVALCKKVLIHHGYNVEKIS